MFQTLNTACTDKRTGEVLVVVSGGFNGSNTYLDSTEILIDGQWIEGIKMNYFKTQDPLFPQGQARP